MGRGVSVVLDEPEIEAWPKPVPRASRRWRQLRVTSLALLADLAPEVYVEVPLDDALEQRLDALAAHGLRAKVRCGGASSPAGRVACPLRPILP